IAASGGFSAQPPTQDEGARVCGSRSQEKLFLFRRLPRRRIRPIAKINRGGIDAVAQTRRLRAVVKNVAEMAAAVCAQTLRAVHPQAVVVARDDLSLRRDFREARPAAAGIKLVV